MGNSPSCEILLVVNADRSVSVYSDSAVGPFDSAFFGDDTMVGIVNDSSRPVDAITVSGTGSNLAGFDADGLCTFITCSYSNPTGYEGPDNTFVVDPTTNDAVEVDFPAGLATSATSYFSLEGAPTSAIVARRGQVGFDGGPLTVSQYGSPSIQNSDGTQTCAGDPVNTASGNFTESFTDLMTPGRGMPLNVTRTYNAAARHGRCTVRTRVELPVRDELLADDL